MKTITKFALVLLVIASTTNIYAQKFGLVAGFNLANMHSTDNADATFNDNSSLKPGFQIGPTIELPLSKTFSFASGTILSTKGFKYIMSDEFYGIKVDANFTANIYYIDIPLNIKGRWNIGRGKTQVYGTFGPYCAIGIDGKIKGTVSFMGQSETSEESITWGNGLNRFDCGLAAGTGICFNAVSLGVSYQYGLANDIQNRVLAFTAGYQFGR